MGRPRPSTKALMSVLSGFSIRKGPATSAPSSASRFPRGKEMWLRPAVQV